MIRHMRHGSPPRLMALQSILSPNRRESLPTPSAGVRITTEPSYAPHRAIAAAAGYRAVQSTPLLDSRTSAPVGMLSTHFRGRHRPSDRDLALTDRYAQQAAEVIAFSFAAQRQQPV